ncbi:MAG: RsmB/NOP family class I SAM-dependent RNA methyltransferase [Planctomycetota bacterium]
MTDDPDPIPALLISRLEDLGERLGVDLVTPLGRRPKPVGRLLVDPSGFDAAREGLRTRGLDLSEVPGLDAAFAVPSDQRDALLADPLVESGRVYVHGAASQRAAELLGAQPGEHVLDLAAAPGGKTLVLAGAMQAQGRLVAVEPIRDRFYRLRANLDRTGNEWVETVRSDGRKLPSSFRSAFDRVLLDAPCSADVRIEPEDPETYRRWGLSKVRDLARKQWGLLGAALWSLKPGGVAVYSTCTFAPEEDEAIVAAHLAESEGGKRGAAEVLDFDLGDGVRCVSGVSEFGKKRWPDAVTKTKRILPDELHEGFFVAKLRKIEVPDQRDGAGRRKASRRRGSR